MAPFARSRRAPGRPTPPAVLVTLLALPVLLTLLVPAGASAQEVDVRAALERFFSAEELQEDWFAESFLDAVPFAQIPLIRDRMTADLGAYRTLRRDDDRWMALYEKGRLPALAQVDAQGRFVGLRLLTPVPLVASFEELAERVGAMPGRSALLVSVDGEDQLALAADEPLAVGSAFKLVVLKALAEEIEAGRRAWDDTVELGAEHRSLPSGRLRNWPAGSPLTLHTLAAGMIAESDNTATDALVHVLGRERVEQADPSGRNRPFLTTAEAFRLKDPAHAEFLERWRTGDEEQRRRILAEMADLPLPSVDLFLGEPRATDVEWFLSARELCALIDAVAALDLTTINPGVVVPEEGERVAYKGGSEPGVLNLTTWIRLADGREGCVCLTREDEKAVDLEDASGLVAGAAELLRP